MARRFLPTVMLGVCAALFTGGCVRRTLVINTEPQGAAIHLNDEEVGRTPVQVDFLWYGDYGVVARLDGYNTLQTHEKLTAPWYQWPVMDFFAEVLWPGNIHDVRSMSFALEPETLPEPEEVLQRAGEFRDEALYTGN